MLKTLLKHKNSNKTIIVENDSHITYKELFNKSLCVGREISEFYNKENTNNTSNVVGVFLPNSLNFIVSFLAVIFKGKTTAPLNPSLSKSELLNLISHCDINLIITTTVYVEFFKELFNEQNKKLNLKVIYIGKVSFLQDCCEPKNHKINNNVNINTNKKAPFVLLPTSGTTGNVKVVALSQKSIHVSVTGFDKKMSIKKRDYLNKKIILITPYFASYGIMVVLWSLLNQVELIVYNDDFSFERICKLIAKHKIDLYEGGAIFVYWLEKINKDKIDYDISSLVHVGFGGSKVSATTLQNAMKNHPNIGMFQGYGMTETSPLVSKVNLKNKSRQLYLSKKLDSVGTAIKGVKIYINVNNKLIKKSLTEGEIVVRGKNAMIGYYKNPTETSKVKTKNMIYTGDIGFYDKDGYIYIIGRKKNVIIVRGLNVYPEQVEEQLENCEHIAEARVYAENKLQKDEFVCADIVLKDSETDLEIIYKYINENIEDFKRPKKINVVNNIKKVSTGKKKR